VVAEKRRRRLSEEQILTRIGGRRRAARIRLRPEDVRKAVLLAEILGPPVAERQDYRLL
jgi:hypothetical protein